MAKEIENNDERFEIAKNLILISSAIIMIFSLVIMLNNKTTIKDIKEMFTIILPLISTWVGAVIAYYFSKENFETAAKTNEALIKQLTPHEKLQSIKAEEIMTLLSKISLFNLDERDETKVVLKAHIITQNLNGDRRRIPFLKNGKIVYMLHKSIIDEFLVKYTTDEKSMDSHTLSELLAKDYYKNIAEKSFETAKPLDNLSIVKRLMDENELCSDVFITEDGTKNGKVLGWITNSKLLNYAKV